MILLNWKYNCKYNYQQAKCEDSELIWAWFQHIQATIAEYSVHKDNIYNFDETNFQMSIISTVKVITESDWAGRPRTTQSDNCEWVTVIETCWNKKASRGFQSYSDLALKLAVSRDAA